MDLRSGPLPGGGLGEDILFATKPGPARTMIERFPDAGHHVGWIAGDEVSGGNPKLRSAMEERGLGYVLTVACAAEAATEAGKFSADTLTAKIPERAWQKLSAGAGAKSNRFYDWTVIDLAEPGPGHRQLLIRRNRRYPSWVRWVTLAVLRGHLDWWIEARATRRTEPLGAGATMRGCARSMS